LSPIITDLVVRENRVTDTINISLSFYLDMLMILYYPPVRLDLEYCKYL